MKEADTRATVRAAANGTLGHAGHRHGRRALQAVHGEPFCFGWLERVTYRSRAVAGDRRHRFPRSGSRRSSRQYPVVPAVPGAMNEQDVVTEDDRRGSRRCFLRSGLERIFGSLDGGGAPSDTERAIPGSEPARTFARPGDGGKMRWRGTARPRGMAYVAALTALRRVARARSRSTAAVAASRAAPMAMRVICQPGIPPVTTVRVTAGVTGGAPLGSPPGPGTRTMANAGVAVNASRTLPARPERQRDGGYAGLRS